MKKKVMWGLLLVVTISLALIFSVGFITSIHISKASKELVMEADEDKQEPPDLAIQGPVTSNEILIIGDSIGFGVGDEVGMGIGERYTELMGQDQEVPQVNNLSIPGYVSADLLTLVGAPENASFLSAAKMIIISIGGNDLNRLANQDALTVDLIYQETLESFKENLQLIVKGIRELNPEAQLALVGLYNPYDKEQAQNSSFLLEWNFETRRIVNQDSKMVYIPTYEHFQYHLDSYLAEDEFHPSGAGYQVIAEQLYQILN